ncbi:hypothetical protein C2E23DRAFT_865488 [Lenzites betulinus]|nr:hypothetical protein C2E23DRAFT_865488 [Lenzites betulinus]
MPADDEPEINATLEDINLTPEVIQNIWDPPNESLTIDDPNLLLGIEIYMAVGNSLEKTLNAIKKAVGQLFCIGFMGAFAGYNWCHKCGQGCFCLVEQMFTNMLPQPQIQAIYCSEEGAEDLGWFYKTAKGIIIAIPCDMPSLANYFDLCIADGMISMHNVVLMNKKSDCWMSLWLVWYKKIYLLPGMIIPSPNHLQVLDLFLSPGFFHVSALMHKGLEAFHAMLHCQINSKIFLALGMADSPGMVMFSGSVRHHGTLGCCAMCGLLGRHKPGCLHYYPALLRPTSALAPGCAYDNISLALIPLPSLCRATGLCKPNIMSGLSQTLPVPFCFPLDLMHLTCLNIPDLFVNLWCGTILGSTLSDAKIWDYAILANPDIWIACSLHVKRAWTYLPGFFDHAPCNMADKLNSGYNAIKYTTWFYNYTPAMLHLSLPVAYWLQLCKLMHGVTILYAEDISPADLVESKHVLTKAHYKDLYYTHNPDCVHVVCPCIHLIWHCPDQIILTSSLISDTQLPMKQLIGNLGSKFKQHANPYTNLSQHAFHHYQLPRGAEDLGHRCMHTKVHKWAWLCLPNGTTAHFLQLVHCIKFTNPQGTIEIREVCYFCYVSPELCPVAMISIFDAHDEELYHCLLKPVKLLLYWGDKVLCVIQVKTIETVVGMILDEMPVGTDISADFKHLYSRQKYFVVKRLGFEIQVLCLDSAMDPKI